MLLVMQDEKTRSIPCLPISSFGQTRDSDLLNIIVQGIIMIKGMVPE
jgi:hypothetical protein